MAQWRPIGSTGNGFAGHLGWHEALFALESLDHAKALALFDRYLNAAGERDHAAARSTPPRCSGGCSCTAPMSATAGSASLAGWALDDPAAAGSSAFNDLHALLALLGAGERRRARRAG